MIRGICPLHGFQQGLEYLLKLNGVALVTRPINWENGYTILGTVIPNVSILIYLLTKALFLY